MNPSVLQNNVQKTASNKRHLEIKAVKSKYFIMSRDHNAGQYQSIIFLSMTNFSYLRTALAN